MVCDTARENIELYVLGELSPAEAEALRSHLEACPACRKIERETRGLLDVLEAGVATSSPSEALVSSVQVSGRAALAASRRRRRWVAVAASVAAVFIAGLAFWSSGRFAPKVSEQWQYHGAQAEPTSISDDVLVRGGTLYLLRERPIGAGVTAVDAATGAMLWESEMPSIGFLEADERRVYALSALRPQTLELVALDARDGTPLWRYEQSGLNPRRAATRPVPLPDGTVCWTTDTTVHMIDATSGEARWTRTLDDKCRLSGAAIRDDSVFLACRKSLHALSSATGEPLWQATLEVESFGERRPMVALDDRRIFVALPKGSRATLLCLDRGDRTLLWQQEVARVHHLLAEDGTLYVRADKIIALNAASGEAAWTYAAQGCGPITRSGGLLHLADAREGGRLVALDKSTGEAEWYLAGLRSCNGFVRSGGAGYIKTLDGVVHAFALRRPTRR